MYSGTYTLIGSELSMFTMKLEAQLRFQGIPYQWRFKTMAESEAIQQRSGTRFVPLLETPDGWMINDTIAIGPMLSDRFSDTPVIPETPAQRAACFVLEDFYNHWLPRHALHSRWCYPDNVIEAGKGFGANMVLGKSRNDQRNAEEEEKVAGVGQFMCDTFGMGACDIQGAGMDQKEAMQADFQILMQQLATHLKQHDFLLGGRACLADFAIVGTAQAHFLIDPEPLSWLGEKEGMLRAYVDRVCGGAAENIQYLENDALPETLMPILEHAKNIYQRFALTSIEAAAKGEKTFTLDVGYGDFTARSMKRLDKARLHVQDELERCNASESSIADTGVLAFYQKPAII